MIPTQIQVKKTPKTAKITFQQRCQWPSQNFSPNHRQHKSGWEKCHRKFKFSYWLAMMTSNIEPVPEEPKTFTEAWNHHNPNSCAKWQEAIKKEFTNMNKSLMPSNWRCEKKWVFKIKCKGVNQACLVACGYSQVPSINFSKNYSPVANKVTFWVLLLMVLHLDTWLK